MRKRRAHAIRHFAKRIPWGLRSYEVIRLCLRPTYFQEGLATVHNADFLRDARFEKALQAADQQEKLKCLWRLHTLLWAGSQAVLLKGDFVECGVNRGALSAGVMSYVDFSSLVDRKFYLFDTFSGVVPDLVSPDDTAAFYNEYSDSYQFVSDTLGKIPNVAIVKGPVPYTLTEVNIESVAYLHIDMNCTPPEKAAIEHFWPKVVKGGLVIWDDYGFSGHESQKKAADDFAAGIGRKILQLPTGQGLLINNVYIH